ncbi:hypothetical protein, partial [Skermania pinensis]
MDPRDNLGVGGDGQDAGEYEPFPLSAAQLGIWYAQHGTPDVPITISQYIDLRGDLDCDVLAEASRRAGLELKSGFLRIFESGGTPLQLVDPDLS